MFHGTGLREDGGWFAKVAGDPGPFSSHALPNSSPFTRPGCFFQDWDSYSHYQNTLETPVTETSCPDLTYLLLADGAISCSNFRDLRRK